MIDSELKINSVDIVANYVRDRRLTGTWPEKGGV